MASISTNKQPINIIQFLSWNPNLIGLCDSTISQYVCATAPGGNYIAPLVTNTTNATTNAGTQQRGGGDGSQNDTLSSSSKEGLSSATSLATTPTSLSSGDSMTVCTPSPVPSGVDAHCKKFAKAVSGDNCSSFASKNGVSTDTFYTWNPMLGAKGAKCDTEFWANYYYCVAA